MDLQSALKLSVATVFSCTIVTWVHPASADVITIPASQDATLFGTSAANNNSSSGPGMFVGADGMSRPKRGLIEFNIPGFVPAGATINSASLSLVLGQVAGSDTTARTIGLFDVTTDWAAGASGTTGFPGPGFGGTGQGFLPNIGDVTWNFSKFDTIPWNTSGGGGDFSSTESAATVVSQNLNTPYVWGSTPQMVADVKGWLDGTMANFGWLLKNDSEGSATTFRAFYTAEGAVEQGFPDFAPVLTVDFSERAVVPEPSTWAMLLLGFAGLGFFAYRRARPMRAVAA
jgi:PEP-CTERM motif